MQNDADRFVTCHWLTLTRSMPHPHCFMARGLGAAWPTVSQVPWT
jgi:hypothetical protein